MSKIYPEGIKITIAGEEFVIMPFVLRTRTKFLKIVAEILTEVGKVNPNMKQSEILNNVPAIIETAGGRVIELYELVLAKDREWLNDKVTLKDEINIIQAILEVNDISFLLSQVKALIPKQKQMKAA